MAVQTDIVATFTGKLDKISQANVKLKGYYNFLSQIKKHRKKESDILLDNILIESLSENCLSILNR